MTALQVVAECVHLPAEVYRLHVRRPVLAEIEPSRTRPVNHGRRGIDAGLQFRLEGKRQLGYLLSIR